MFFYIIDSKEKDNNNIIKNCNDNGYGYILFDIYNRIFIKKVDGKFKVNQFSKFNSCFLFKTYLKKYDVVNSQIPIIIEELKKDILENIFEPLFEKDMNIPEKYYIYEKLKVTLDITKQLTNYSFIILTDLNDYKLIKYIYLEKDSYYDYQSKIIITSKNIKNIQSNYDIKLVAVLIPIKVKHSAYKKLKNQLV